MGDLDMENEKLYLTKCGHDHRPTFDYGGYVSLGVLGECTGFKDVNGEDIHIGDMVKVTKPCGRWWSNIVIQRCQIENGRCLDTFYYTVSGMASHDLRELCSQNKVERVMSYTFLNQEYRRHVHYIVLSEKYMDFCYDFVDGVWTKVK